MKLKVNKNKLKKVLGAGAIILSTTMFAGCGSEVITEDVTKIYDTLDSNDESGKIVPQEVEVQGEDFKLIIENSIDRNYCKNWTITSNKQLLTRVYTKGLPADTKVWIDNIHTDTYLVSTLEGMNGIKQDSMDDHSHSQKTWGFPISDTVNYYGTIEIEGQDKEFIEGYSYGYGDYESGRVVQKRRTESELLEKTVYANEISSIYDLWIQKGDNEPYMTTAKSTIIVLVYNKVTVVEDSKVKVYHFDRNGNYEVISERPYSEDE